MQSPYAHVREESFELSLIDLYAFHDYTSEILSWWLIAGSWDAPLKFLYINESMRGTYICRDVDAVSEM